ncbi:hypothetical protein FJZ40_03660 [Candidatus Shapirobacteria bacterium]|nr:hypothetical protein [Candidatus Shapirobacteria bacterium]
MKREEQEAPETREGYLARITEIAARGDQQQLRELATELKLRWAIDPTRFFEDVDELAGGHAQVEFYKIFGEPGVPKGVPKDRLRLLGAMRPYLALVADFQSYRASGSDVLLERIRTTKRNLYAELDRLQKGGQGV